MEQGWLKLSFLYKVKDHFLYLKMDYTMKFRCDESCLINLIAMIWIQRALFNDNITQIYQNDPKIELYSQKTNYSLSNLNGIGHSQAKIYFLFYKMTTS